MFNRRVFAVIFITSLLSAGCVPTERTVYTPDRTSSTHHDHHDGDHESRSGHGDGDRSITVIYDPSDHRTAELDRTFRKMATRYDAYEVKFIDAKADRPDRSIRAKMRDYPAIIFYNDDGTYSHTMEGSQISDSYAILKVVKEFLGH